MGDMGDYVGQIEKVMGQVMAGQVATTIATHFGVYVELTPPRLSELIDGRIRAERRAFARVRKAIADRAVELAEAEEAFRPAYAPEPRTREEHEASLMDAYATCLLAGRRQWKAMRTIVSGLPHEERIIRIDDRDLFNYVMPGHYVLDAERLVCPTTAVAYGPFPMTQPRGGLAVVPPMPSGA